MNTQLKYNPKIISLHDHRSPTIVVLTHGAGRDERLKSPSLFSALQAALDKKKISSFIYVRSAWGQYGAYDNLDPSDECQRFSQLAAATFLDWAKMSKVYIGVGLGCVYAKALARADKGSAILIEELHPDEAKKQNIEIYKLVLSYAADTKKDKVTRIKYFPTADSKLTTKHDKVHNTTYIGKLNYSIHLHADPEVAAAVVKEMGLSGTGSTKMEAARISVPDELGKDRPGAREAKQPRTTRGTAMSRSVRGTAATVKKNYVPAGYFE